MRRLLIVPARLERHRQAVFGVEPLGQHVELQRSDHADDRRSASRSFLASRSCPSAMRKSRDAHLDALLRDRVSGPGDARWGAPPEQTAIGSNHGRHCERSEAIQESSGALRPPGSPRRFAPRDDDFIRTRRAARSSPTGRRPAPSSHRRRPRRRLCRPGAPCNRQ